MRSSVDDAEMVKAVHRALHFADLLATGAIAANDSEWMKKLVGKFRHEASRAYAHLPNDLPYIRDSVKEIVDFEVQS